MAELAGQVAIVTGSSRGIGRAMAVAFARAGADVVVAARTDQEGGPLPGTIYHTAEAIRALGRRALPIKTDVSQDEQVEEMVRRTLEAWGRIDILVNNAAAVFRAPVAETPIRRWDLVMRVNLRAAFLCIKAVLPTMMERHRGHIISVSPPPSLDLAPGGLAYGLAKTGVTLLSLGLAKELQEHNIGVNCLWPAGGRATEGMQVLRLRSDEAQWLSPDVMADAALHIASQDPQHFTGRALTDEEVLRKAGIIDLSRYRVS